MQEAEKKPADSGRVVYFDLIRIIALFSVIGVHWVGTVKSVSPDGVFYQALNHFLETISNLGVPIFFSLSGYLILHSEIGDVLQFYRKRLIRLGIPYLVFSVIYVVYFTGIEDKEPGKIPLAYIRDILTAQVHGTHWFVYALLGFTFAAPFLSKMLKSLTYREICILLVGSLTLTLLADIYSFFGQHFPLEGSFVFCGNLLLYIGGYCANRIFSYYEVKRVGLVEKGLMFLLVILFMIQLIHNTFVVTVMISSIIFAHVKRIELGIRVESMLRTVSNHSYSIYLIHAAVVSLLWRVFSSTNVGYVFELLSGYIIVFCISFIAALIIDLFITDRLISLAYEKK